MSRPRDRFARSKARQGDSLRHQIPAPCPHSRPTGFTLIGCITPIMTNFHFYLIQLWRQFFQMFVYGNVVYAQTWEVLTLKNCIEPPQHASTAYVFALFGCLFFLTVL